MTEIAVVGRPVVVGVDGSESAARAVRWAAREAARRTAPLVIVHACPVVAGHVPEPAPLPRSYHEAVLEQGRERLAEAEAEARGTAPEVEVRTELVFGGAAEDLVGRSASAQLVVLGSRGLGGFTGLLVGSIAVAVSTHGHCPVVVVRGTGPEAGGRREGRSWWAWTDRPPARPPWRSRSRPPRPGTRSWWRCAPGRTWRWTPPGSTA
ncbi:universal stress protein [Saccharothrix yanglingensis]|uniref:universal stress protein n=1 Tax=Saccharothrix yanglingensis TaxID=659496 RepID=UPI0027D29437|nr:universal stress protein [Saccharothrix yanglingensis]